MATRYIKYKQGLIPVTKKTVDIAIQTGNLDLLMTLCPCLEQDTEEYEDCKNWIDFLS